jgi:hemolysin activation/secretion protein
MMRKTACFCATALLAVSSGLQAQTRPDPAAVQRLDQENLEQQQREKRLEKAVPRLPRITVPGRQSDQASVSEVKNIPLTGFEVGPSELLTAAEIAQVLAPYQGRTVSLKDLFDVVDQINGLYEAKGIRTARAILPAQELKAGVVRIRLVEARLGTVEIAGTHHLDPQFVRDRLQQRPGDLMSVERLESDLIRYNALYESQLRAGVVAGGDFGTTDVTIDVQEPKRFQLTTFADNAGRDSVGKGRVGAIMRSANLLQRNDSMQLLVTETAGSKSYGWSVSTPITRNDLRLDAAYSSGSIRLVNGPFVPLDITGTSKDLTLGLTQPFAIDLNRQWGAYARWSDRDSESRFGGFTQQDLNLHVVTLGLSADGRYGDRAWNMDHSLNLGTRTFGADARFSYYRGSFSRIDRLGPGLNVLTRGGLQYSFSRVLPSGEQFQVGGLNTVRGYSEGLLTGRSGYFASIELRAALNPPSADSPAGAGPIVQGLVFLDHGGAFPYRPGEKSTKDDYLSSAGVGLIMDFDRNVSARLTLAVPLGTHPADPDSDSPRWHAGINIAWF